MPPQDQKKPQDEATELDRLRAEAIRAQQDAIKAMQEQQQRQAQAINPNVPAGYSVVKTVPEKNGIVYRSPTGKLAYVERGPEGGVTYSSNNEAEVQRILAGEAPRQAQRTETQKQILEQSGGQAAALSAVKGIPFVGEYLDEAVGMITGDPRTTAAMREMSTAYQEQKPVEAFAGQMALGGLAAAPFVPFQAAGRALQAAPTVGKAIAGGVAVGAGAGATEGAISGFGAGEGTAEQRIPSAQSGATFGGIFGGVLGGASEPARFAVENMVKFFGNAPSRKLAKDLGIDEQAAKVIQLFLKEGDIDSARAALNRAGSKSMLAEVNQSTKNLLDAAIQLGSGSDAPLKAMDARAVTSNKELTEGLNRFFGVPRDLEDVKGEIWEATEQARKDAYDAAFASPINYNSAGGQNLLRQGGNLTRDVIATANKLMQTDPRLASKPPPMVFDNGQFQTPPNVMQWDYIARALQSKVDSEEVSVLGRMSQQARNYDGTRRAIRDELKTQVPVYKQALGLAGDTAEEGAALELGNNILRNVTTVGEVLRAVRNAEPPELAAMKQGIRTYVDETLGNLRISAANPNTDIKELSAALSMLRSRNNMNKLKAVLGPVEAEEFYKLLDEQATTVELRAAVAANSKTAQRQALGQAVSDITTNGILGELARGKAIDTQQRLVQSMTGLTPEADAVRRMGLFDDVASVLTRLQGQDARDALEMIELARRGRVLTEPQARIIAKAVTKPAAMALYAPLTAGQRQQQNQPTRPYQSGMGREATE
jgi:hypothetical protein